MRTLFDRRLAEHALACPAHPAVAMPGDMIGYPGLRGRVQRCAAWLVREGCRTADPAGVIVVDDLSHLIVSLALLVLGIPQIGLSAADPLPMQRHLARRLSLGRIIVDTPHWALDGVETITLTTEWLHDPSPAVPCEPVCVDDDAPALFASSSGTTGTPKIIALSQRVMAARSAQIAGALGFAPDERVMLPMPVEHYLGKSARLYALLHGATAILPSGPPPRAPALLDLCAELGVTFLQLTLLQARDLLLVADSTHRLPLATRVFLGAARMPPGFPRLFEGGVGGRLYDRYGACEANLIATTYPCGDDGTLDSVGRPVRGIDFEVVDVSGRPLPPGEIGEIRTRSDCMVHHYHDDPVATARHFRDGWFHPGDLGSITPEGNLRLLGRNDDMMMLNGINIFPAEIERVLEEHPAVKNAAAFPIPSANYGDIPAAAVELEDAANASVAELLSHAREHLGVRAPRRIMILDKLPRNAAGKVVKHEIATMLDAAPRGTASPRCR